MSAAKFEATPVHGEKTLRSKETHFKIVPRENRTTPATTQSSESVRKKLIQTLNKGLQPWEIPSQ